MYIDLYGTNQPKLLLSSSTWNPSVVAGSEFATTSTSTSIPLSDGLVALLHLIGVGWGQCHIGLSLVDFGTVGIGSLGVGLHGATVNVVSVGQDLDLVIGQFWHFLGNDGRSSLHHVSSGEENIEFLIDQRTTEEEQ